MATGGEETMKLLLAEDEIAMSEAVVDILNYHKYSVDAVYDGEDALYYARSQSYDGIILDVMMPKLDGLSVLRQLRRENNTTPVLLLTARAEVEDRIGGLDAGADDYLPKPFSTAELLARVRAMLRRKDNYLPDLLTLGPVTLNRSTYQLSCNGGEQTLSGKEFQLLEMMMQTPGTIIATERFITHLWGWDTNVDTSVIWVHISNLRKKINALGAPLEIRFVRGAGYLLEVRA